MAFCAALVTSLVLLLNEGGLEQGDKIASIASMMIAAISLPITVYTAYFSIRQDRRGTMGPADQFDAVVAAIADAVRAQWESEEQIRHVHDLDHPTGAGVERTERHLRFLARHVRHLGTHDLAWWRFVLAVPRGVVGVAAGLVIMLATWVGAGFAGWAGRWPDGAGQRAWVIATLVAGVVCGVVGGTIVGQGRGVRPSPARLRLRIRGRLQQILGQLTRGLRSWRSVAWLVVWTGGGVLFGLAASVFGRGEDVVVVGLAAGVFAGFGMWFLVSFVWALGAPVDPTEIISPLELLRTGRRAALRQGLVVGVGGSAVFWLMLLLAFEPAFGVPFEIVFHGELWLLGFLIMAALGLLIWMLFVTVWAPGSSPGCGSR